MGDNKRDKPYDVLIVGGLGHVGLPLGIVLADTGLNVCLLDIDEEKARSVREGKMPFIEYDAGPILEKALEGGNLHVSLDIKDASKARYVIIAIGTPVDEYLNPKTRQFIDFFKNLSEHLDKSQTVIVRSTVYPHTCRQMMKALDKKRECGIAYCPERIVQGYAIRELRTLPQIVAGMTKEAEDAAAELFGRVSPKIIRTSMGEAELVKLYSNAWRYIQFAVANQFYMMASNFGVDYDRVRKAMREEYERALTLPGAGFAAGPCLLKDTMQLSAFNSNNFLLGHAAMMVNEGLPNYIVETLRKRHRLSENKVGILGMAFKADIDDIRDSLSYKLGKILRFHGADVYYSDEYVEDPTFVSKEELIGKCDIIIVGVPHSAYKDVVIPEDVEVVDTWNVVSGGRRTSLEG
ncbi:MAG: nucleotide sugar dehydrogenase [Candidatus Altiarchaeales archaeon]|nr:nucleotide sugar dehydrogenase [Candidatus Altiarchaeales archaeon]MBD3415636.1 nucleotide sugar dehydrogenase [Candidatus Altiarchaeales archaeon]